MNQHHILKKTLLAVTLSSALGVSTHATADMVNLSWSGLFTWLSPNGDVGKNTDYQTMGPWYGWRTPITGTMSYDTAMGTGSGTIAPFSFLGGGAMTYSNLSFQTIGNGLGGPGTLMLGNMSLAWGGTTGIPISIVWDAAGFLEAGPYISGQTISGVGTTPATNNQIFNITVTNRFTYLLPIGAAPLATTTWNTTDVGTVTLGTNPNGTLPLIADTVPNSFTSPASTGIGGSPMKAGPFPNFNFNFDVTSLHVTSVVPIPAAVWLFGSGLMGLIGMARRRRRAS